MGIGGGVLEGRGNAVEKVWEEGAGGRVHVSRMQEERHRCKGYRRRGAGGRVQKKGGGRQVQA